MPLTPEINRYRDLPLVQYGELEPACSIASPETLPTDVLERLLDVGLALTYPHTSFAAIAFTEIPNSVFFDFDLPLNLKRTIYVSEYREAGVNDESSSANAYVPGCLLFNPIIAPTPAETQIIWEGCGSIDEARHQMWVCRPYQANLSAWCWNTRLAEFTNSVQSLSLIITGRLAGLLQHEADHLDGLTVLNRAKRLLGPASIQEKAKTATPPAPSSLGTINGK